MNSAFTSVVDLVEWVSQQREGMLQAHLLYDVHLVEFAPPCLKLRLTERAPKNLPKHLEDLLKKLRDEVWMIAISAEMGQPSLHEKEQQALEERRQRILQTPLVKTLIETFPGTTLTHIEDN
ncbi:MAG: hypothetical protein U1A05_02050 [Alphaproteobacteria bacterium]|nr:hypothetical protein [Alphaproteobacteria bacterium]